MIRQILAILFGFLAFAQGLVYVVIYGFVDPLLQAGPLRVAVLLLTLVMLGLTVGGMVGALAGGRSIWATRIVAGLCTIMMIGNVVLGVAVEPIWFKLSVMGLAIPGIVVAERLLVQRRAAKG